MISNCFVLFPRICTIWFQLAFPASSPTSLPVSLAQVTWHLRCFPNTSFASSLPISTSWFHHLQMNTLSSSWDPASSFRNPPLTAYSEVISLPTWAAVLCPVDLALMICCLGYALIGLSYFLKEVINLLRVRTVCTPLPGRLYHSHRDHVMAGSLIHEHSSTDINSVHSSTQLSMSLKVQYWYLNMRCECDKVKKTRERK